MEVMSDAAKKELHALVDTLPVSEVRAARRYLEFLQHQADDPVRHALDNAPIDDEPETEEEAQAVAEAREELARGEGISHEEMKQRLGL